MSFILDPGCSAVIGGGTITPWTGLGFRKPPPVTLQTAGRQLALLFSRAPWERKGPQSFFVTLSVPCPTQQDFELSSVDEFSDSHIAGWVASLLGAPKTTARTEPMTCPPDTEAVVEEFDGVECRIVKLGDQLQIDVNYTPAMPDRQMPVFFWLGELAEAA